MRKGGATVDKPKNLYFVESPGGREMHVWASSGEQAKRAFCKQYGIKPNDWACGIPALHARKLKPAEVEAWERDEPSRRATLLFIRGMLEIESAAYQKRTAEG